MTRKLSLLEVRVAVGKAGGAIKADIEKGKLVGYQGGKRRHWKCDIDDVKKYRNILEKERYIVGDYYTCMGMAREYGCNLGLIHEYIRCKGLSAKKENNKYFINIEVAKEYMDQKKYLHNGIPEQPKEEKKAEPGQITLGKNWVKTTVGDWINLNNILRLSIESAFGGEGTTSYQIILTSPNDTSWIWKSGTTFSEARQALDALFEQGDKR